MSPRRKPPRGRHVTRAVPYLYALALPALMLAASALAELGAWVLASIT